MFHAHRFGSHRQTAADFSRQLAKHVCSPSVSTVIIYQEGEKDEKKTFSQCWGSCSAQLRARSPPTRPI
jgi:hypothetical protein